MNTSIHSGTALITGASSGIGAVYADRLARRGHDLVLVARDRDRLCALAAAITDDTGRSVEVLATDLGTKDGLRSVERVLADDASMTMLVNNAGRGAAAPLLASDPDGLERIIDLNVTAPLRLACAAWPAFAARGHGTIINIASVAAKQFNGVHVGAMAFVLAFSQSLHHELASMGIRVQAVFPAAGAAEFGGADGTPVERLTLRMVMSVTNMVDAALAGLDLGEIVTIPSLPDAAQWDAYQAARRAMRTDHV
jgi:short-subunit dehydrogenase